MHELLQGPTNSIWNKALRNEWGRLAQGNNHGVTPTDTIEFIEPSQVPAGRKVTYVSFVYDHRPLNKEPWILRLVVGGGTNIYETDAGSTASNLIKT